MSRPTALVTGASKGIGRAVALRLAPTHDVVALARSAPQLETLAAEITKAGGRCTPLVCDVAQPAEIAERLRGIEADVLINNAGVGMLKPLLETSPEEWHQMVNVNLNALYHVTRAVLPGMVARGRGEVITIGSLAGRNTFAGGSCYAATKHAVIGFSESLMLEVRERGVRVSVVMPGSVATEFGWHPADRDTSWMLQSEDVAEAVAYLLAQPANAHVSRVEMRPARPAKKG
jgi:3-hydroxy acid dehydrogenase / malonic semialdehyde reductase